MAPESPDSTTARTAVSADGARMNIGEVLELLREDFPSISIPKIRFLEDKGLIKPERTPAGYRKFSADDVDRLRYVLRPEFPGITIPTIRFLEDKGLISPERTPAGYRKFTDGDEVQIGKFRLVYFSGHAAG